MVPINFIWAGMGLGLIRLPMTLIRFENSSMLSRMIHTGLSSVLIIVATKAGYVEPTQQIGPFVKGIGTYLLCLGLASGIDTCISTTNRGGGSSGYGYGEPLWIIPRFGSDCLSAIIFGFASSLVAQT